MKPRGLSLAETVVALFVLVVACLGCVQMFHLGLRASAVSEKRAVAAFLANKRLTQVQVWAKDASHFASWSGYPNGPDSDFPEYPIQVTHSDYTAASPSSQLQGGSNRQLVHSLQRVQVDVAYPPYQAGDHLKVVSLVGEPPHSGGGLVVLVNDSAVPSPMSAGSTASLSARLQDGSGNVIQDALFDWGVAPDTGNGTVYPDDNGRTASFKNEFLLPDGSLTTSTGKTCSVEACTRYMGRPVLGCSGDIHL
ncbi:hypothetical protein JST97_23010 [bacterium]|nr:hypothetical protein [bacterium]